MDVRQISRRELLRGTVAATTAAAMGSCLTLDGRDSRYDAKGLPTRELGRTGVRVPLIGLGNGSRFCIVKDEDQALEILTYALDHGLYYWDTAHDYRDEYVISEERLGKILKYRRKEVFLATKVGAREPDEAKRHIEESLTRLQTDHLDILQVHSVGSVEDLDEIEKGGMLDVVRQMREQGVARYIGFTGHSSAEAMALAAKRYDFDTMLIALNHYREEDWEEGQDFENEAVPVAAARGLGVMLIKAIRPRETVEGVKPADLIRYALSLKHVDAAVIAHSNLRVLKENIELIRDFKPLDAHKMDEMRVALSPFYRHEGLEWMRPPYRDGLPA